jgi:hypothetical protein
MNADSNETELVHVPLRSAFGKMKAGRKRPTRRMVNSVAASKWIAPGRSITCSPAYPRVSTARR